MKRHSSLLGVITLASFVFLQPGASQGAVIFKDGFESGNLSNGYWLGTQSVSVSSDRAYAGSRSAKFSYSAGANSFSELRFDLKSLYKEVWIGFKLYIPANYAHLSVSPNNNKFFRLWPNDYNDCEKVGASTWQQGGGVSRLDGDWGQSVCGGIGPKGAGARDFIGSADKGKWMDVKIQVIASTSGSFGTLKIWKNGALIVDNTNTVNNYAPGELHAYRYGYLLGWANGGFVEATNLYIDDVVFATAESDLTGATGSGSTGGSTGGSSATGSLPTPTNVEIVSPK